jgi:transcriptional regulator with GAF, ATPase, and Fis domain
VVAALRPGPPRRGRSRSTAGVLQAGLASRTARACLPVAEALTFCPATAEAARCFSVRWGSLGEDQRWSGLGTIPAAGRTPSIRLLGAWMSAVADLVRAVNAAEPLDELLGRIAEQACRLIGFDFCAVMLADPTRTWLRVRGSHGLPPDYVEALNREHTLTVEPGSPDHDTVTARAFREAVTLTVRDIARADGYGATRRWAQLQGFGALLSAPLLGAGGPAGVVVAYSRVAREFTASEIELVELLAQHAVLALETADLRAVQQETIAELEHKRQVLVSRVVSLFTVRGAGQ